MFMAPGGNASTTVPFTNDAAGGTDYINDGYFYFASDFTNNKSPMPAGEGTTFLMV